MRLICPNCNARYEVPENVIPKNGRDVECSSCGHTWFEAHPSMLVQPAPIQDPVEPIAETNEDDDLMAALNDPLPEPSRPAPKKSQIDPELAEVLKEEVAREMSARKGGALESQPDLGLEDNFATDATQAPPPEPRTETSSDLDELETLYKQGLKDAPMKRSELFPDIEDINSTLSTSRNRADHRSYETKLAPVTQKPRRFRGFVFGLTLVAAAAAAYIYAADISQMIPQVQPYMDQYVSQIDMARAWLDQVASQSITWLETQATKARQAS